MVSLRETHYGPLSVGPNKGGSKREARASRQMTPKEGDDTDCDYWSPRARAGSAQEREIWGHISLVYQNITSKENCVKIVS